MKKFGDIRDSMPPACPVTGYDCGNCDHVNGQCRERALRRALSEASRTFNEGEKIWGTTQPLIVTPMFEMHRLGIKPWHRCSYHTHHFKHNAFYVIEGTLFIDWQRTSAQAIAHRKLGPGDTFTIRPDVAHQFRTGSSPCVALEMYYTEPLSEDIVRYNIGAAI